MIVLKNLRSPPVVCPSRRSWRCPIPLTRTLRALSVTPIYRLMDKISFKLPVPTTSLAQATSTRLSSLNGEAGLGLADTVVAVTSLELDRVDSYICAESEATGWSISWVVSAAS